MAGFGIFMARNASGRLRILFGVQVCGLDGVHLTLFTEDLSSLSLF